MRLRKNLKLTPSMIWSTAATPECPQPPPELMEPHICVLNRAPWDAPPSPPTSHQFLQLQAIEVDDSYPNTFFPGESLPNGSESTESMKISTENDNAGAIIMYPGSGSGNGQIATGKSSATPAARKNNDDKNNGNKSTLMGPPKRRGRPRKKPLAPLASSDDNPSEYYYYSGFGPWWGKKRGGGNDQHPPPAAEDAPMAERTVCSSRNKESSYGGSLSSYSKMDDELDFVDDDFDDDDDDEYGGPRKRARKPVKARSLKSLM